MRKQPPILLAIIAAMMGTSCQQPSQQAGPVWDSTVVKTKPTDLLTGSWVQPNPINEREVQGFTLLPDGHASSVNMSTLLYKQWWSANGQLILVAESIGNRTSSVDTTSYTIVQLTDSVLEIKNGEITDRYTKNKE